MLNGKVTVVFLIARFIKEDRNKEVNFFSKTESLGIKSESLFRFI